MLVLGRWMELPYAFQCCAFISCDRKGGSSWEKEEAVEAAGRDAAVLSSQGEPSPSERWVKICAHDVSWQP